MASQVYKFYIEKQQLCTMCIVMYDVHMLYLSFFLNFSGFLVVILRRAMTCFEVAWSTLALDDNLFLLVFSKVLISI